MTDLAIAARRLVERTRKAQGLPLTITDAAALRRIAAILAAAQNPSTQRKDPS